MLREKDYRNKNRREQGGANKVRLYPCGYCGGAFSTYGEQKRHLSTVHGKSTKGYDRALREEIEGNRR